MNLINVLKFLKSNKLEAIGPVHVHNMDMIGAQCRTIFNSTFYLLHFHVVSDTCIHQFIEILVN